MLAPRSALVSLRPSLKSLGPSLHSLVPRSRGERALRLVVVGNGMVSHRLCEALLRRAPRRPYAITVLGEEALPAYDRIRLSESLTGDPQRLLLAPRDWYDRAGICLRLGTRVQAIFPREKCVLLSGGERLPYDLLVLSTGAAPLLPDVPGMDSDRVFVYRTVADVARIHGACRAGGRAAVIGGGLLGIEAARLLRGEAAEVLLIERGSTLMPRQLDGASGALLSERVREQGVSPLLGEYLNSVQKSDNGLRLGFASGRHEAVDLLVVAAGVRPRDELARAAGLRTAAPGGVIVDDGLRTSERSIYAIGECAVHRGTHYGLVSPGYAMADALAARLCGRFQRFVSGDMSCQLKLLEVPVSAVGIYQQEARAVAFEDQAGRRTLLLDGRRLIGATAVGDWPELPLVHAAALREARLSAGRLSRFVRTGSLWPEGDTTVERWPAQAIVCSCALVSREQLGRCIGRGLVSVEALTRETGAGGVCGGCKPLLGQLLGQRALPDRAGALLVRVASVAASLLLALLVFAPGMPAAAKVDSPVYQAQRLLHDAGYKQITGFGLLAFSALGAVLSIRKRSPVRVRGRYGYYRAMHTVASACALGMLVVHSGLNAGSGLNRALFSSFVALCCGGALSGLAAAAETSSGWGAIRARRLRPLLTRLHIVLLWPLPVLLALHIWVAYHF